MGVCMEEKANIAGLTGGAEKEGYTTSGAKYTAQQPMVK